MRSKVNNKADVWTYKGRAPQNLATVEHPSLPLVSTAKAGTLTMVLFLRMKSNT